MAVSMDDLRSTFGVSGTVSLSQFYRGGAEVPNVAGNGAVATSGTITLGSFTSRTNYVNVSYDILGGGGGGGYGNQELDGQQVGPKASAGGTSTFSYSGGSVAAAGGGAGASANQSGTYPRGTNGANSAFGTGGTGGRYQEESYEGGGTAGTYRGGDASGYGAGGGGGGGDQVNDYDSGGYGGTGGGAGARKTGSVNLPYKSTFSVSIGGGGAGGTARGYDDDGNLVTWGSHGGSGSGGRIGITKNYLSPVSATYTSSASNIVV